ncbi:MAG: hypothetical protein ACLFP2_01290 [Candidatus Woesearchaeota archaeon]
MKKAYLIVFLSIICLYFVFGVYSFPDDAVSLEHYSINVLLNKERQEEAQRERSLLRNKTYEIMLFHVKNYYEKDTTFNLWLEPVKCASDDCGEDCNKMPNKFCHDNGSFTVSIPDKVRVSGYDRERMFIDVGVRNDAVEGTYSLDIVAVVDNSTYDRETFRVNVGRESFDYNILEKSPETDGLYIGLMALSFFLSVIVFFLVFMFHGKS